MRALKFRSRRDLAGLLGELVARQAPPAMLRAADAIVPVPLHPVRRAARGFNQAELLVRPLAERYRRPVVAQALRRVRQDAAQVRLSKAGRRANVAGAFAPGPARVRGTVLLFDDVFSTGATAAACAQVLRAVGADRVLVLTLARAVGPGEPSSPDTPCPGADRPGRARPNGAAGR